MRVSAKPETNAAPNAMRDKGDPAVKKLAMVADTTTATIKPTPSFSNW